MSELICTGAHANSKIKGQQSNKKEKINITKIAIMSGKGY